MADDFQFGIEEEYFLADNQTGRSPQREMLEAFHAAAADAVEPASHELLQGQVEVQSAPGTSLDKAFDSLATSRRKLAHVATDHGLRLFASGSHPLGREADQHTTQKQRYQHLADQFGLIAARSMVCAMHIHVEVPEPRQRIALMNRITPFLPLLFALSANSPFWEGQNTGLKAFRLAAFAEWPRMGLPELFKDDDEFDSLVARLTKAGVIENSSFIWWLVRPSNKYPTIELRVCDSCTRLEDAVAIAALYRALLLTAHRRPDLNGGFGPIERGLCAENIWQAQRYGLAAEFVTGEGDRVPVAKALADAVSLCEEAAHDLGDTAWVGKAAEILARGGGANRQLAAAENGSMAAAIAMLEAETLLA